MIFVGVDPGKKGAIALYLPEINSLVIHDMPGKIEDIAEIMNSPFIAAVITEKVHSLPGNGAQKMFVFGYGAGVMAGICAVHKFPFYALETSVWKTIMGLSSDKKLSLALAIKKFPQHAHYFKRAMDDGRAEAALLAWLGADRFRKK